jgi:hypothetical protein
MSDFKPVEEETPTDYDWDKPSLGVVVLNANNLGMFLWWVGGPLETQIDGSGSTNLDDLGLEGDIPQGISIWEGRLTGGEYNSYQGDYEDTLLTGTFRPPTDEEWAAIRRGDCPWDGELWWKVRSS